MKTTKFTFLLVIFIAIASFSSAQTLGEFKPNTGAIGMKKAKNAKRIFIPAFFVNYQVYFEKQKAKAATSTFGGGSRGAAVAEASVGLDGLAEKDVQSITDKLYKDFIDMLKTQGYDIITAEEAAKTETYNNYQMIKGGNVSLAQIPGIMSSAPSDYQFFVKSIDKSGKTKTGGFMGPQLLYPKLSKELGDAIIAAVGLTVLFVEEQNGFQGNGVNIKVKTNLRLENCDVSFYHGKQGMGSPTQYTGTLKKPFDVDGVIADKKIQSVASGGLSSGMYGTFFNLDNRKSKTAKFITVDSKLYTDGVYAAASKFLSYHTKGFLDAIK